LSCYTQKFVTFVPRHKDADRRDAAQHDSMIVFTARCGLNGINTGRKHRTPFSPVSIGARDTSLRLPPL